MKTVTYTCDICSKSMDHGQPDYIVAITSDRHGTTKVYELCADSYMDLDSFLRFNENWNNDGGVIAAMENAR
jgi:hypothetical protein